MLYCKVEIYRLEERLNDNMTRVEKVTDMIVFNTLQGKGYVNGNFEPLDKNVYVWIKQSGNEAINRLLSSASKKKTGKKRIPGLYYL